MKTIKCPLCNTKLRFVSAVLHEGTKAWVSIVAECREHTWAQGGAMIPKITAREFAKIMGHVKRKAS